jgi:hypothetical protein
MPVGVVTVTSTVPDPGGDVAVMAVALFTAKTLALVPPNIIKVAPLRLVPEMVTLVPPEVGPLAGEIAVTEGPVAAA